MRVFLSLCLVFLLMTGIVAAAPSIVINIPEYRLTLYNDDQPIKTYDIAVGTAYEQTPLGSFKVFYKEKLPTWTPGPKFEDRTPVPPGPDNPLGTRWMEFHPTYGIHGTNKGWDIQYPVSGGCIRMHDKDAQELYELVDIGTPVTIVYETILLEERVDGLYAKVMLDIYNKKLNTPERFMLLYAPYAAKYPKVTIPSFPKLGDDEMVVQAIKVASELPQSKNPGTPQEVKKNSKKADTKNHP